jgi:hypothetical protein
MDDAILDEIRRVRAELLRRHGGWKGYFQYVRKVDLQRRRQRSQKGVKRKSVKASIAAQR